MPALGDQYRDTKATTNPFEEVVPHMQEYTAQQIATLQSRLDKQLGPEYISTRPGAGGGKLHYLAADKVINLANEIFGFNGWSSSIQNVQIDFVDENPSNGKITLGLSTIVRVTLRDGSFHEDTGYGHIENCKGKAAAFEKAKKEAATDAMKRALRNFGNVLGNCLYDKDYLARVTKLKPEPSKWSAAKLHRHPDYAPTKDEQMPESKEMKRSGSHRQSSGASEYDDEFGDLFDETDFTHPDEVRLDDTVTEPTIETAAQRAILGPQHGAQIGGVPRMHSMPHLRPPNVQPPPSIQHVQAPQKPPGVQRPPHTTAAIPHIIGPPNHMPPPQTPAPQQRPQQIQVSQARPQNDSGNHGSNPSSATESESDTAAPARSNQTNGIPQGAHRGPQPPQPQPNFHHHEQQPPPDFHIGFVTSRAAEALNPPDGRPPTGHGLPAFNPHAESPSIRRTQGVNPGRSAPVNRKLLGETNGNGTQQPPLISANGVPPISRNGVNGIAAPPRNDFLNPAGDPNRRIGMPPGARPGQVGNTTPYRAPSGVKRPALADVSNLQQMDGALDAKKPKVDVEAAPAGESNPGRTL